MDEKTKYNMADDFFYLDDNYSENYDNDEKCTFLMKIPGAEQLDECGRVSEKSRRGLFAARLERGAS